MTHTIDGAVISPEMLEQIVEWQHHGNLEADLITIEKSIDLILEQDAASDMNSESCCRLLHHIKELRFLAKNLMKFQIDTDK